MPVVINIEGKSYPAYGERQELAELERRFAARNKLLPSQNQWDDIRDRPAFQIAFHGENPHLLLTAADIEMEQTIDDPVQEKVDDHYAECGFPDDVRKMKHVYMEMPRQRADRYRQNRCRLPPSVMRRNLQIRRAMRLENQQQEQIIKNQCNLNIQTHIVSKRDRTARKSVPLDSLPNELLMDIISRTHIDDVPNLEESLTTLSKFFHADSNLAYNNILKTQYPHWMKALGGLALAGKIQGTERQRLSLCRAMASISYGAWVILARSKGVKVHRLITATEALIQQNQYPMREYLVFLSFLDSRLDRTIEYLLPICGLSIKRAAVACLEQFTHRQTSVYLNVEDEYAVKTCRLSWRQRRELFEEQDEGIQNDVSSILEDLVSQTIGRLGLFSQENSDGLLSSYKTLEDSMQPIEFLSRVARYAVSMVLNALFRDWRGFMLATQIERPRDSLSVDGRELDRFESELRDGWDLIITKEILVPGKTETSLQSKGLISFTEVLKFDLMALLHGSQINIKLLAKQANSWEREKATVSDSADAMA